jgi:hypothetical protein
MTKLRSYQGGVVAVFHHVLTQGEDVAELGAHRILQVFCLEILT